MPYSQIKPDQIKVFPLSQRKSKSNISEIAVNPDVAPPGAPELKETVKKVDRLKCIKCI